MRIFPFLSLNVIKGNKKGFIGFLYLLVIFMGKGIYLSSVPICLDKVYIVARAFSNIINKIKLAHIFNFHFILIKHLEITFSMNHARPLRIKTLCILAIQID
jgi:hypothetical protein